MNEYKLEQISIQGIIFLQTKLTKIYLVKKFIMSLKKPLSNRKTNSRQRQTRAIVNLQQLSQSPWHLHLDEYPAIVHAHQPAHQQKTYTNTIQSTQLPLHPKQQPLHQSPTCTHNRIHFASSFNNHELGNHKSRPNTIHNSSLGQSSQIGKLSRIKNLPLMSLNFYEQTKRSFNTFDQRSRLNDEIQLFAEKIRHEGSLIQSLQQTKRARTSSLKQPNTTNMPFKTHIAKRSFFYKQCKDFLYSSFKVDGRPVQIKRDRYSIESHGLPKKKSIYSFKDRTTENDFFAFNRTDGLRKKVARYELDDIVSDELGRERKSHQHSNKKKAHSLYDQAGLSFANQTIHARPNEKEQRKQLKGKLWLGRPPVSVVVQEQK